MTRLRLLHICTSVLFVTLAACSSIENMTEGDRVDYRTNAKTTAPLVVPPDLTQLARVQTPSGAVSASAYQASASAVVPSTLVLPQTATQDLRIERAGNERWLSTRLTPEQIWPQLRAFWQERGFKLVVDEPGVGVMETEWAENRAKLPHDIIRRTIGRVLDSLYSTSELDKFRTRIERTAEGSEVYISHRGMVEVYVSATKDQTSWQPRPVDPQLEAEFLTRLMAKLGNKESDKSPAAAAVALTAAPGTPHARLLDGAPGAALQVDEGFERAWRRVGLALDRSGFTVEDRDRSGGLYYVRYVDPAKTIKEEPGFFSKLFGGSKAVQAPERYRIAVKPSGDNTTVSVLDAQGAPERSEVGKRIVALLVGELR